MTFNIALLLKALIGAMIVVLIQLIASTRNYYIAALVPLFPFFGLISYYIVGTQRGVQDLRTTIIFGIFGLIPYLSFLVSLLLLTKYCKLQLALFLSSLVWTVIAVILVIIWNSYKTI